MDYPPQPPSPAMHPIAPWLQLLAQLYPPTSALIIGAGSGTGPWIQALQSLGVASATLVEADDTQFENLQRNLQAHPGWQLSKQVVAAKAKAVTFYLASQSTESGLIPPESLRGLWPNLKTLHKVTRQAVSLAQVQAEAQAQSSSPANWILVDCLPARFILESANPEHPADVIVLRVILGEQPIGCTAAGVDQTAQITQDALQKQGFRCVAIEPGRHPGVGHALYVRDTAHQISHLEKQLSVQMQDVKRLEERLSLAHANTEQALAAKTALEVEVAQAKTQADETSTRAVEHAARVHELTLAAAVADNIATERQQQIEKLQAQLKQASAQATDGSAKTASEIKALLVDQQNNLLNLIQKIAQPDLEPTITDALDIQFAKHLGAGKENLKEVENRLRIDMNKGFANSVKQIEAFMRIQSYLGSSDSLGDFHGWPISPDIGILLLEKMRGQHYDLILEFGSGTSTVLFAKAVEITLQKLKTGAPRHAPSGASENQTQIFTFEHDKLYHERTSQLLKSRGLDHLVKLEHAPLIEWRDGEAAYLYYDCQATLSELAKKYAHQNIRILMLVDGPPGATCPNARYPAVPMVFASLGRHRIDVVLDDASRPEEKTTIELWRSFWKKRSMRVSDSNLPSEKGIYLASSQR